MLDVIAQPDTTWAWLTMCHKAKEFLDLSGRRRFDGLSSDLTIVLASNTVYTPPQIPPKAAILSKIAV
jgi:hypothetical protein